MKNQERDREKMRARLMEIQTAFEREMRLRGFDPSQAHNVPLTPTLAKLLSEHEELEHDLAVYETGENDHE